MILMAGGVPCHIDDGWNPVVSSDGSQASGTDLLQNPVLCQVLLANLRPRTHSVGFSDPAITEAPEDVGVFQAED